MLFTAASSSSKANNKWIMHKGERDTEMKHTVAATHTRDDDNEEQQRDTIPSYISLHCFCSWLLPHPVYGATNIGLELIRRQGRDAAKVVGRRM